MSVFNIIFAGLILILSACTTKEKKYIDKEPFAPVKKIKLSIISNSARIILGDSLSFSTGKDDIIPQIDSSHIFVSGKKIMRFDSLPSVFILNTTACNVGKHSLKIKSFSKDEIIYSNTNEIEILSDIVPEQWKYQIKNIYKHDDNAYTQGLLVHNNVMYEGTGQKGASSLRRVDLKSGKILQSIALDNLFFGEGITVYKDKIIQLTWQSRKVFVYDINTFDLVTEFQFNHEGWGLTTIGDKLYASDGSHKIYILDANNFSELNQIQVYNNYGKVDNINEMEYIDDKIFANIYGSNKIIVFDPLNGKITAEIDMTGILPKSDYKSNTDVLNGIAYNNQTKQLFVTGKNWPKLFEIELFK